MTPSYYGSRPQEDWEYPCLWRLRLPRAFVDNDYGGSRTDPLINSQGKLQSSERIIYHSHVGDRLACWVDLRNAQGSIRPVDEPVILSEYPVGAKLTFGHYEQDNHPANGAEPIEWTILQRDGNRALLLSDKVLGAAKFHDKYTSSKWEGSTLRAWLNSEFLSGAFSPQEHAAIAHRYVYVINEANGSGVQDKVFLLDSLIVPELLPNAQDRLAYPTVYAVAQGVKPKGPHGESDWLLRSCGKGIRTQVDTVKADGNLTGTTKVNASKHGIRPAIWVNLDVCLAQAAE